MSTEAKEYYLYYTYWPHILSKSDMEMLMQIGSAFMNDVICGQQITL